nr:MAG: pol protein [Bat faecal associated retrovirus 1]
MEKVQAAQQLVREQLELGHIEPSNSPWNSPIFVIKKKSGKWRLLQDLRAVNKTMQPMGALQPGLPSPVAIQQDFHLLIIDLKDCFYTIPLFPEDCQRFAFSVPSPNFQRPMQRYHWKVLPQGMANSPTLCQKFVDIALQPVRKEFPEAYIIHYMDDILLAASTPTLLALVFAMAKTSLAHSGLKIAEEKVQISSPYQYLGQIIDGQKIRRQKIAIRTDSLLTLNDWQKMLGDLNWIRPALGLTTAQLKPLFDILKGDAAPNSPRNMTSEAEKTLQLVNSALNNQFLNRIDYNQPWVYLILGTPYLPTGLFWQNAPLEWLHLPATRKKVVTTYPEAVAQLILIGRRRALQLFGLEPSLIITPYKPDQISWLLQTSDNWQIALAQFMGQLDCHYPSHKVLQFFSEHSFLFPKLLSPTPIDNVPTVFTDGSNNGKAVYVIDDVPHIFQTDHASAQRTELAAVIAAFTHLSSDGFNLYSDSRYVVTVVSRLETAVLHPQDRSDVITLFLDLQTLIRARDKPFFVGHIRAHSQLPGPLATGNDLADSSLRIFNVSDSLSQAKESHAYFHQNSQALRVQFSLTREQARQIVKQCTVCGDLNFHPPPHLGVNPRGFSPGQTWQMDVTHYAPFGRQKYIHVIVDTFSGFYFAQALTGEAFKHVTHVCLAAFALLGVPQILKTDNGPAYTSSAFANFCAMYHISHVTGIPYNPQGQGIVERAHRTLKTQFEKIRKGDTGSISLTPAIIVSRALFTLNFLNLDEQHQSAADRHWGPSPPSPRPRVRWKDPLTGEWHGPDPVLIWGRGSVCIFPRDGTVPRWLPTRLVRPDDTDSTSLESEDEGQRPRRSRRWPPAPGPPPPYQEAPQTDPSHAELGQRNVGPGEEADLRRSDSGRRASPTEDP